MSLQTPTEMYVGGITSNERLASTRVLAIAGSLRGDSFNRRLLQAAASLLPDGASMVLWEQLKEIPPFDEDDEAYPGVAVSDLRRQITVADAVLIATPEYNGSMPGQLKNALDWASRPYETNVLRDKPVAVIGASPTPGGTAHANADARRILSRIGAQVIAEHLLVARAFEQFGADGTLVDLRVSRDLGVVVSSLVAATVAAARRAAAA